MRDRTFLSRVVPPSTDIEPLEGVSSPRIVFMVVVFPAPFGPRNQNAECGLRWRLMEWRSSSPLISTQTSLISIIFLVLIGNLCSLVYEISKKEKIASKMIS